MTDSLLPPGATRAERAIEAALARATSLPVGIGDLAQPRTAPDAFIPWLAWGLSTDLWDRDWPAERKRAAAVAWYRLHRIKGTEAGIAAAVRFFDAELVATRRPPDAPYPDPSLTPAERELYLARFRQIRVFRFRSRGRATFGAFLGLGFRRRGLFPGSRAFPAVTEARARIGRRAFVFDPLTGEERPVVRAERIDTVTRREAVTFEEVRLPGEAGRATFLGGATVARRFLAPTAARGRVFTLAIDTSYIERTSALHISAVLPNARPVDVRPRLARLSGGAARFGQVFPMQGGGRLSVLGRRDDGRRRAFLPPTRAAERIFDQVFLFDPDRLPDARHARTFLGRVRLGMPPYNARLTVEVRGRRSPVAVGRFVTGFLIRSSTKPLDQVIGAVRQAKSLRDRVVVSTRTLRPAQVGDALTIGTITVGALVRDI